MSETVNIAKSTNRARAPRYKRQEPVGVKDMARRHKTHKRKGPVGVN